MSPPPPGNDIPYQWERTHYYCSVNSYLMEVGVACSVDSTHHCAYRQVQGVHNVGGCGLMIRGGRGVGVKEGTLFGGAGADVRQVEGEGLGSVRGVAGAVRGAEPQPRPPHEGLYDQDQLVGGTRGHSHLCGSQGNQCSPTVESGSHDDQPVDLCTPVTDQEVPGTCPHNHLVLWAGTQSAVPVVHWAEPSQCFLQVLRAETLDLEQALDLELRADLDQRARGLDQRADLQLADLVQIADLALAELRAL